MMSTMRTAFRLVCALVLLLAVIEIAWMGRANSAETAAEGSKPAAAAQAAATSEEAKTADNPYAAHYTNGTEPTASAPTEASAGAGGQGVSPKVAESVAKELETKRSALDQRDRELDEREARLKEREKEIDSKIKSLEQLRAAVGGELDEQRKNNEDKVKKLVTVFETMTPKSSAAVFETLDDWLAVEVLKRMDTTKVAKVMNIMDKTRSAHLSEMLTGYYHPETDRKVSSIKNAGGQAAAGQQGRNVASAPQQQAAPTNPQAPQNPK